MITAARCLRDERGVGAIEFVLAFPIFLLLVLGALEVGFLFMSDTGLSHGVNEAARYATLYPAPTDAQLTAKVISSSFSVRPEALTLTVTRGLDPTRGKFVTLAASYNFRALTSLIRSEPIILTAERKVWIDPD
jgi:Flp pilus assembly protein TadG